MLKDNTLIDLLKSISPEILNGVNYDKKEFVRRLFNYPAMMIPSSQEPLIEIFSKFYNKKTWIIDPFMGSSTTLVTAMKYGFNVYGQDINPLSVLLSKVKTSTFCCEKIEKSLSIILEELKNNNNSKDIDVSFFRIEKWFKIDVQVELTNIRRAILKLNDIHIRRFFWIVMAETIRLTSNDRTSTFKLHSRPINEIETRTVSPVKVFKSISLRSIEDIRNYRDVLQNNYLLDKNLEYVGNCQIAWGNSLKVIKSKRKFDLLITSPPYGDNHTTVTYGQHSYLPLQWIPIDEIDAGISCDFLKTAQEIDNESLGGRINSKQINKIKEKLFVKSNSLKKFYNSFDVEEKNKLNKVITFFSDIDDTLQTINKSLNKNAYLVWTIGNRTVSKKEVRNDLILIELLKSIGIVLVTDLERDILNKRMPKRNNLTKTIQKEKILIFQKQ